MREKPILFSTPMVNAILEGKKNHDAPCVPKCAEKHIGYRNQVAGLHDEALVPLSEKEFYEVYSPYQKGDVLWVRETWMNAQIVDEKVPLGVFARKGFEYKATYHSPSYFCWKPSIYMPREAARLFLEVLSVRVERLQKITEADAIKEGLPESITGASDYTVGCFRHLWDSLNAERGYSWESNPWVWVIEFRRIEK